MVIEILVLYAPKDEKLCIELEYHLKLLERSGLMVIYHEGKIKPGADYKQALLLQIQHAHIILPLISCYFMASNAYVELEQALLQPVPLAAHIIPITLQYVDWQTDFLGKYKALPKNNVPVSSMRNRHQAWASIAQSIRELIVELTNIQPPAPLSIKGEPLLPILTRSTHKHITHACQQFVRYMIRPYLKCTFSLFS